MSALTYRRGSIFWALTLIAVGMIFLYQNFNPAVHPWQIIAKFWPVLIIFWGLSKLIDHFQARAHPETAAPPLFSGSEVILLLLVLVLGTLVSKIVLRPWHDWPGVFGINVEDEDFADLFLNSYTYTQTISQPVSPQPHLMVEVERGDIEMRGADQSTIEMIVKKTIRAENENAAKKLSDDLKVEIVEEAGQYVLRSNRRSLPNGGSRIRLDLVLQVPKATSAEITSERGDIILDGLRGDETLTTRRGDTHLSNIEGLVRIHKTGGLTEVHDIKGNVEVDGHARDVEVADVIGTVTVDGDFNGNVEFRNISQTLRFRSSRTDLALQKLTGRLSMEVGSLDATGIDGPVDLSTRQKDVRLEEFKHSVKIANTNGEVQLRTSVAPTHPIEVNLGKGDIELALPTTSSFQIDASSRHGEVASDFSGPNLKVTKEGDAASISGAFGKGGPTIHLVTTYGTIRLARQGERLPAPNPARGEEKRAGNRQPQPSHPRARLQTKWNPSPRFASSESWKRSASMPITAGAAGDLCDGF